MATLPGSEFVTNYVIICQQRCAPGTIEMDYVSSTDSRREQGTAWQTERLTDRTAQVAAGPRTQRIRKDPRTDRWPGAVPHTGPRGPALRLSEGDIRSGG